MCLLGYAARPVTCWTQPGTAVFGPAPRFFLTIPAKPAAWSAPSHSPATPFCSKALAGFKWSVLSSSSSPHLRNRRARETGTDAHALLARLRNAVSLLLALPRLSVRDFPDSH